MSDKKYGPSRGTPDDDASKTIKDPDTRTTGAQLSYLKALMNEAKMDSDEAKEIIKGDASKLIEELREKNTRVQDTK